MNRPCLYYCEGECEQKLIDALKLAPSKILPGKSKKLNIMQRLISKSLLLTIKPNTNLVLVFDTDVTTNLDVLKRNIANIRRYCTNVKLIYLLQVKNLEDELVRCTKLNTALDLTRSSTLSNFKSAFSKMKDADCRHALERQDLNVAKLWSSTPPNCFGFLDINSHLAKI